MFANSEGSGETARMRKLAWTFAGRLYDKYHNLMSWHVSRFTTLPLDASEGLWCFIVALPGDRFIVSFTNNQQSDAVLFKS